MLFLECRFRHSAGPAQMVSSLILLRSLRVYKLKQLFFSISVNSGFRNIYLVAPRHGKYNSHYSPRFQRIIVNCSVTNLKYTKNTVYAYCVPKQSTVNNRSPNLLRSGIHHSLHVQSDFRPSFSFFLESKTGSVGLQATEKVKVHLLSSPN